MSSDDPLSVVELEPEPEAEFEDPDPVDESADAKPPVIADDSFSRSDSAIGMIT